MFHNGIVVWYKITVSHYGRSLDQEDFYNGSSAWRGGTAVLVGVGRMEERFSINALVLPLTSKSIKGCMYGSVNTKVDFQMYMDLYKQGQLDLDRMISQTYSIDEAPQAFADLEAGSNARGVILFD